MQITIIAVGNLREKYWKEACNEYIKRLQPYAKVKVVEIAEAQVANEDSQGLVQQAMAAEGERILKAVPSGASLILLDRGGRRMSSEDWAAYLEREETYGQGAQAIVIGGSYGIDPSLHRQAKLSLSFSDFTFPHQLMRVILLEQVYRAMKIRRGEKYHK